MKHICHFHHQAIQGRYSSIFLCISPVKISSSARWWKASKEPFQRCFHQSSYPFQSGRVSIQSWITRFQYEVSQSFRYRKLKYSQIPFLIDEFNAGTRTFCYKQHIFRLIPIGKQPNPGLIAFDRHSCRLDELKVQLCIAKHCTSITHNISDYGCRRQYCSPLLLYIYIPALLLPNHNIAPPLW